MSQRSPLLYLCTKPVHCAYFFLLGLGTSPVPSPFSYTSVLCGSNEMCPVCVVVLFVLLCCCVGCSIGDFPSSCVSPLCPCGGWPLWLCVLLNMAFQFIFQAVVGNPGS